MARGVNTTIRVFHARKSWKFHIISIGLGVGAVFRPQILTAPHLKFENSMCAIWLGMCELEDVNMHNKYSSEHYLSIFVIFDRIVACKWYFGVRQPNILNCLFGIQSNMQIGGWFCNSQHVFDINITKISPGSLILTYTLYCVSNNAITPYLWLMSMILTSRFHFTHRRVDVVTHIYAIFQRNAWKSTLFSYFQYIENTGILVKKTWLCANNRSNSERGCPQDNITC